MAKIICVVWARCATIAIVCQKVSYFHNEGVMLHIQCVNICSESRCRCGVERSNNNNRIIGGKEVDTVRCVKGSIEYICTCSVHFVGKQVPLVGKSMGEKEE